MTYPPLHITNPLGQAIIVDGVEYTPKCDCSADRWVRTADTQRTIGNADPIVPRAVFAKSSESAAETMTITCYTPSGPVDLVASEPSVHDILRDISMYLLQNSGHSCGAQQVEVAHKFFIDARRLLQDPATEELGRRRYEAAIRVLGGGE